MAFKNPWAKSDAVTDAVSGDKWKKGGKFFNRFQDALKNAVESVSMSSSIRYFSYDGKEWDQATGENWVKAGDVTSGVYVFDLTKPKDKFGGDIPNATTYISKLALLKNPDGSSIAPMDFENMASLVCAESGGRSEGFLYTAHIIRNMQELRQYAAETPNLASSVVKSYTPRLGKILNDCIRGLTYTDADDYRMSTNWSKKETAIREASFTDCIKGLTRFPSKEGDGGLLDGNWHSQDPSKGAVAWKGSLCVIGSTGCKYKTRQDFESEYDSIMEHKVIKYDCRYFYYGNNTAAVWEKVTSEWLDENVKVAGGGPEYQQAVRRVRGGY